MTDDSGTGPDDVPSFTRRSLLRGIGAAGAAVSAATMSSAARPRRTAAGSRTVRRGSSLVFAVTESDAAGVRPLVDDYARRHGVAIELRPSPDAGLLEGLTINLTQGTGAYDVVSLNDPWIPAFAGDEILVNLEEMLDGRGIPPDPDFVPELIALGEFPAGSGLRAVPWLGNIQLFASRRDRLAELGLPEATTWDDVVANARAITDAGRSVGRYGFGLRGQTGAPAAAGFLPVLRGYGGDLFDADWQPRLETPAALRAMETLLALAALAPPGVEKVGHEENGRNLRAGIVAQTADLWPDQLLKAVEPGSSECAYGIAIGPEPAQPGVRPATMTGVWLLGIPEASRHPEAALDFVLWLTSPAQQKRLLMERAMPPTRTGVLRDAEAGARFPLLPDLLAAARSAVPRPRTPYYSAVETIVGRAVAEAIAGRLGGEAALRRANSEIRAYLVREGVIEA